MLREVQVDSSKRIQAGRKTPTASRGRQDSLAGPATEAQVELTFGNASGFVADTNGLRLQERAVDPKLPVGGNVYPAVTEAFGAQRRVLTICLQKFIIFRDCSLKFITVYVYFFH